MYSKHLGLISRRQDTIRMYALKSLSFNQAELQLRLGLLYANNPQLCREIVSAISNVKSCKTKVSII